MKTFQIGDTASCSKKYYCLMRQIEATHWKYSKCLLTEINYNKWLPINKWFKTLDSCHYLAIRTDINHHRYKFLE